jgi:hypothetical protein
MFLLPMPSGLTGSPLHLASVPAHAAATLVNALQDALHGLLAPLLWLPLLAVAVLTVLVVLRRLRAALRLTLIAAAMACVALLPHNTAQGWLQDMSGLALAL